MEAQNVQGQMFGRDEDAREFLAGRQLGGRVRMSIADPKDLSEQSSLNVRMPVFLGWPSSINPGGRTPADSLVIRRESHGRKFVENSE